MWRKNSPPSPSLLEACSTSSYPQAKASEFQSQGGREEVLKEKEKGTSSPWVKWGTAEAGRGRPGFLAGERVSGSSPSSPSLHTPQLQEQEF